MKTLPSSGNLLEETSPRGPEETFNDLVSRPGARIERIVSHGHASPEDFWYDQGDDEWVAIIAGEAELMIEGEAKPRLLEPGDWVLLPAHCRHRVVRTAAGRPTVWLAVHVSPTGISR